MLATTLSDALCFKKPRQLTRAERRKLRKQSSLAHALHVAGIPTLNRESVERYKAERLEEYHRPKAKPMEIPDESYDPLLAFSVGASLVFACSLLLAAFAESMVTIIGNTAGLVFSNGLTKSIMGRPRVRTVMRTPLARIAAAWRTMPLEQYVLEQGPIPKVEREKTQELQARLPEVEAVVHYLYEDPFIEVVLEKNNRRESAFIGFWDEKGFSA